MKKEEIWRWVERIVLIGGIVGMWASKQADKAVFKSQLDVLNKNYEKHQEYIEVQNEINGKFIILYDYFITGGTGTREEAEGN